MPSGSSEGPHRLAALDAEAEGEAEARPLPHEAAVRQEIEQSDREMIRVYEDLVDLLIEKNLVILTDLPPAAQNKLLRRKRLRAMLSPLADIINTEDDEPGIP